MNRRTFIKRSGIGTAAMMTAFPHSLFAQNNKLRIGLIGSGWYGLVITKAALQTGEVEVVAVCDVDSDHLKKGADEIEALQGLRPIEYKDYKELLDIKGLDAVLIGTITHWHALQLIDASKKGLPVYCEKPLSYDVEEGRAMVEAVQKAGNIVQIGFQRRQNLAYKKAKELIEKGTIGKVNQINAQIHYRPGIGDTTVQEPPATLDWKAWCGPAPLLPYRPSIGHGSWRFEKEFGNGHLMDWGIHHIDIIRTIMSFDMPTEIKSTGSLSVLKDKTNTPDTLLSTMKFDNCPIVWQHRLWGLGDLDSRFNNGIFFYGDKGTLFANDDRLIMRLVGENQKEEVIEIPTPDMQEKHVAEFIRAVKTNNKNLLSCTIEDAFKSTATVQLAMISYYTDSNIVWDLSKGILDNSEAEKLLSRPYRKGYTRP